MLQRTGLLLLDLGPLGIVKVDAVLTHPLVKPLVVCGPMEKCMHLHLYVHAM